MDKVCKSCGQLYPRTAEHFYRDRSCSDGLKARCKKCDETDAKKAYGKKWREKNKDRYLADVAKHREKYRSRPKIEREKKTCSQCQEEYPATVSYFSPDRVSPDGLRASCRKCGAKKSTQHYRKNREKKLQEAKAYRLRNAEKLRRVDKVKRDRIRAECLIAYGSCCSCCGETEPEFLTLEHINRDGAAHREKVGQWVYGDLKRRGWPNDGYTLLCWNCNCATKDGKLCPHVRKKPIAA